MLCQLLLDAQGKSRGPPGAITWAPRGNLVGPQGQSRGPPLLKKLLECGFQVSPVSFITASLAELQPLASFYTGTENNSLWELIHTKSEIEGRPETIFQLCCRYYCLPKMRACGNETKLCSLKNKPIFSALLNFDDFRITPPLCKLATAALVE